MRPTRPSRTRSRPGDVTAGRTRLGECIPPRLPRVPRRRRVRRRPDHRVADAVRPGAGAVGRGRFREPGDLRPPRSRGDRRRPTLGADSSSPRCRRDEPRAHAAGDRRHRRRRTRPRRCTSRSPRMRGRRIRITIDGVRDEQTRLFGGTGRPASSRSASPRSACPASRSRRPRAGAVDSGLPLRSRRDRRRPVPVRVDGPSERGANGDGARGRRRATGPRRSLRPGTHVLTTARGQAGRAVDRPGRARVGGSPAARCSVADGRVSVGDPAPAPPPVTVVHNGDTEAAGARRGRDEAVLARARRVAEPGLARARRRRQWPRSVATRRRLRERLVGLAAGVGLVRRRVRVDAATAGVDRDLAVAAGRAPLRRRSSRSHGSAGAR